MKKILLTGASGLLGKHLTIDAERPTHEQFNIVQGGSWKRISGEYELIVHCAGYTNVAKAETDKSECFDVNVKGTLNLLEAYPHTPFVYISSEYAHNPVNFYGLTKFLAEEIVKTYPNYLIIRTLFKPFPWPFDKAFTDQYTQGGYINHVAPLIEKAIIDWDRKTNQLIYVGDGRGRKTMYKLASKTKKVLPNSVDDIKNVKLPKDYE